ncbi:helix-turn-helix domain-containing protein [Acuticoccus kandeliae]|uniref:helix-turn-helix domain-containing protein n=1 Tax=Acuticoccus kandeliae TaxID=2073160 RepID=UPI000D3E7731|nr:helix-turn-helix domain-containing protein [Acuticoccus kandeliae]
MNEMDVEDAPDSAAVDDEAVLVATRIRELRRQRGWSVQELAERSKVSVGMISQLERRMGNPSLKTLTKLCLALDVKFAELVSQSDPEARFVRRKNARPFLDFGPEHFAKEILSPVLATAFQMMILHVRPMGRSGETLVSYPAEKGGLVIEGEIILRVGNEESRLREGDSFQFNGAEPHSIRNEQDVEARVLWIIAQSRPDAHI